jgi:hypothetical protein
MYNNLDLGGGPLTEPLTYDFKPYHIATPLENKIMLTYKQIYLYSIELLKLSHESNIGYDIQIIANNNNLSHKEFTHLAPKVEKCCLREAYQYMTGVARVMTY